MSLHTTLQVVALSFFSQSSLCVAPNSLDVLSGGDRRALVYSHSPVKLAQKSSSSGGASTTGVFS